LFVFQGFASTFLGVSIAYLGAGQLCIGIALVIIIPNRRRRYTVFDTAFANPADEVTLVEDQPVPNIAALHPPININLGTRTPMARFVAVSTWIIPLASFAVSRNPLFLLFAVPFTIGILVSIIQAHDVVFTADAQEISISEEVIAISPDRTKSGAIAWDDVLVFALIQQLPNGARVYMLSSGDHEVRWKHRRRTHWYSLAAPATSDEVYNQQMEALLSYAAARTGLPLLDMR
jgi:hypothetical protein